MRGDGALLAPHSCRRLGAPGAALRICLIAEISVACAQVHVRLRPCLGNGCPCGALRLNAAHRAPAAGVPCPRAGHTPAHGGMHASQVCLGCQLELRVSHAVRQRSHRQGAAALSPKPTFDKQRVRNL